MPGLLSVAMGRALVSDWPFVSATTSTLLSSDKSFSESISSSPSDSSVSRQSSCRSGASGHTLLVPGITSRADLDSISSVSIRTDDGVRSGW